MPLYLGRDRIPGVAVSSIGTESDTGTTPPAPEPVPEPVPELVIKTATARNSSNSTTISFTGLEAEPRMFSIVPTSNVTSSSSSRSVVNVSYDGSKTHGVYTSSSTGTYSASYFSWTYSNGTLTVKTQSSSNGGYFRSNITYQLTAAMEVLRGDE